MKYTTLLLSVYLPAVTHVLLFQIACEMTSHWCVPGRVDSAKKHHVYYCCLGMSILIPLSYSGSIGEYLSSAKAERSSRSKRGEMKIAYKTGPNTDPYTVPRRTSYSVEFFLSIEK